MTATTNVFVPIAGGVKSSRSDRMLGAKSPTLLSVGEGVIQLANGIVDRFWQVIKRPGGVALPVSISPGVSLPPPWRLASRGNQLVSFSGYGQDSPAYALSPGAQKWIPAISQQRGPVRFTRTRVAAGAALESPDFAYLPGFYATAHLDGNRSPVFTLLDETNGQVVFADTRGGATNVSTHVKVVACNGTFTVFFTAGGNGLKCVTYDPTTFSATPRTVSAAAASSTRANLDAIKISSTVIKAVYQIGSDAQLDYVDYTPSTGAVVLGELTTASAGHLKQDAMAFVRDLANTGRVSLVTVGGDTGSVGVKGVAMLGGGAQLHYNITAGTPASTLAIDGGQVVAGHRPVMRVTATSRSATTQDVLTLIELAETSAIPTTVDPVDLATTASILAQYTTGTGPPASAVGAVFSKPTTSGITVDGVTPTNGMRILVKDQANTPPNTMNTTNGIYIVTEQGTVGVTPWAWTRAIDFDEAVELGSDVIVSVTSGATNAGKKFIRYGTPTAMETASINGSLLIVGTQTGTPINFVPAPDPLPGNDRFRRSILACSSASGAATQASWMLGLGLSSVPFKISGRYFVLADYDNTPYPRQAQPLQSSFFLIELPVGAGLPALATPAVTQANIAVGAGGGCTPTTSGIAVSNVPSVFANAAGELVIPIKVRNDRTASSTMRGVELCRVTSATPIALGNSAAFGEALVMPGAVVSAFDGVSFQPIGFPIFPEPPTVAAGLLGNQAKPIVYRWQTVYRWTDARGRVYRSQPSAPVDVKAQPGALSATITVPTYRMGDKMAPASTGLASAVTIELYRSQANIPGLLYYVTETPNDPTVQTVAIVDTATDSTIGVNELLYTTGGVLSNDPLPGASEVCYHGGRLFLVSMDDPSLAAYSQPNNGGDGAGFPNAFAIQRPSAIAALASFIENLILFEGGGVFRVSPSTGPDAQGRGLFPDAQTLEPGTTTAMPLSVCVSTDGAFFRPLSPLDGLQMVNRALQVVPKGLDVQKYSDPIVGSAYLPKQGQARFWTAAGTTLVYDSTHDLWSTFTGQGAGTATSWDGVPVYYSPNVAAPIQEQAGIWTDFSVVGSQDGSPVFGNAIYDLDIFSPWFSPLGTDKAATVPNLGGYFLLRNILGIGSGQAGPTLVELRKDFDAVKVISSHTGTPGPKWDWVVRGAWKLSCFQVRIRERSATAGPVINGFTVGVGPKRGISRLPSGNNLPGT